MERSKGQEANGFTMQRQKRKIASGNKYHHHRRILMRCIPTRHCALLNIWQLFFPRCRIAISERYHKEGRHDARPQLRNIFTQDGLASIVHKRWKEAEGRRTKLLVFFSTLPSILQKNQAAASLWRGSQKTLTKRGSCLDTARTLPGHS
jgi:hypothetical protein